MFGICVRPSAESQAKGEYLAQRVSHSEKILNSKPDHKPELNEPYMTIFSISSSNKTCLYYFTEILVFLKLQI